MCRAKQVANGSKEDIERLRNWVKKGKAWAMVMLAGRYIDGVGVKQSDKKAIELFEMAAKRGDATAQFCLGLYYDEGKRGVTQSTTSAIEFYTLAAAQGFVRAQSSLGTIYAQKDGIDEKQQLYFYAKAREWWTKAAAQGDKLSIEGLKVFDKLGM